ncbi:hypothetical protein [Streptomyces beigongshangae]|uniref:hypothetical protein n=1 Tax=Streptomyces beigongshangae TaxID=2841597 RepID=UPI003D312824
MRTEEPDPARSRLLGRYGAIRVTSYDAVRHDLETRLMDESRQSPAPPVPRTVALLRGAAPPPALCGFLLLLVLVFTASHAAGASAGPVAPGMHGTGTSGTGGGGTSDMEDMGGMEDMGETGGTGDPREGGH